LNSNKQKALYPITINDGDNNNNNNQPEKASYKGRPSNAENEYYRTSSEGYTGKPNYSGRPILTEGGVKVVEGPDYGWQYSGYEKRPSVPGGTEVLKSPYSQSASSPNARRKGGDVI